MDPKVAHELSLRIPHLALRVREHRCGGPPRALRSGRPRPCSSVGCAAASRFSSLAANCSSPPCTTPWQRSARAKRYAEGLESLGARVVYPGLHRHPQHALLQRIANPGAPGAGAKSPALLLLRGAGRAGQGLQRPSWLALLLAAGRQAGTLQPAAHFHALAVSLRRAPAAAGYGFGGMLTVELPTLERAKLFMERLQNKHSFGARACCARALRRGALHASC